MKLKNKLVKSISFTLMPRHNDMIDELIATGEFLSRSQVVRDAISYFHKKYFPYYKVTGRKKEEEEDQRESNMALPAEEYAVKILEGDLEAKPGFCQLRHKNLTARTVDIPINLIKNYASRNEVWKSVSLPEEN